MNYIKIFQNSEALYVSVGNYYSEDQIIHTILDNFHQGGKYSDKTSSQQAELRREEKFTDPIYLSISSLQTDYLNLERSSSFGSNIERSNTVQIKCTCCGGTNHSAEKISK